MKGTKTATVIIGITGTIALLAGCVPSPSTPPAAHVTVARVSMDPPTTLNPAKALGLPDYQLARLSYDTLVRRDDSGFVAGLASSWKTTPTEGVFTIRDGATCADGTKITPTIVANSLKAYVASAPPTSVVQTFGGLKPTITADDAAKKVTITLTQPWVELVAGLTVANTGIVCPSGLADAKGLADGSVQGASGPYVLKSQQPGIRYVYTLRKNYTMWPKWTTKLPGKPPQTIDYTVTSDPSATANMVLSGQLDLARIMPDSRSRFTSGTGIKLKSFPFGTFYTMYNERPGNVFADAAKRKAVAQALDREQLFKTSTDGTGELLHTLASSTTACVSADHKSPIIPVDKAAASSELKGVKIRLLGAQVVGANGAGNVMLQDALRSAGADVTLDNVDVGTWAAKAFGQPNTWDLTIFPALNFLNSFAYPLSQFVGPDLLKGGANIGDAQNATATRLTDEARATANAAKRCTLYNEAADSLIKNADTVPLYAEAFIYAQRPGFAVSMLGGSLDDQIFRITS